LRVVAEQETVDRGSFPGGGFEALPPPEMAHRAETVGVAKATAPNSQLLALAVLAGAFIAMGAVFSTTVMAGGSELPYGVARLLGGLAFSLGLVLVVVAGAELFTGNNLVVMAWASRRIPTRRILWTWTLVYFGNLVGAVATAAFMYLTRQYTFGDGAVGEQARKQLLDGDEADQTIALADGDSAALANGFPRSASRTSRTRVEGSACGTSIVASSPRSCAPR
jgi:formate/nitrite transporter